LLIAQGEDATETNEGSRLRISIAAIF